MKIATFNVWNENKGFGDRRGQIIEEILNTGADLIALQEITPQFYQEHLQKLPQYPYSEYGKYIDEEEGLAILSRYPFSDSCFLHMDEKFANSCALNVLFCVGDIRISVTDVHLPWDSARVKEE